MNTKLATTLVIGALILPVAGYAADNMSKDKHTLRCHGSGERAIASSTELVPGE